MPPKRLNGPPQSYIHETDPIFYTLPAWEALLTEARSVAEPKPADYRLSIVDPPAVDDEETIPILDGPFKVSLQLFFALICDVVQGKFAMATPHQPIRLQFREFFERLHATVTSEKQLQISRLCNCFLMLGIPAGMATAASKRHRIREACSWTQVCSHSAVTVRPEA